MIKTTYSTLETNHPKTFAVWEFDESKLQTPETLEAFLKRTAETVDSMAVYILGTLTGEEFSPDTQDTMLSFVLSRITNLNTLMNTGDAEGFTLLHRLAKISNQALGHKTVKLLLKHCSDINIMNGPDFIGKPKHSNAELDEFLKKCTKKITDDFFNQPETIISNAIYYFQTPLYSAVEYNNAPLMRLFLIRGGMIPPHLECYLRAKHSEKWTNYQAVKAQLALEKRARFEFVACSKLKGHPVSWLPNEILKLIWLRAHPDEYFL